MHAASRCRTFLSSSLVLNNVKNKMYIIIILSVVLCGSLTLGQEHTLMVLESSVSQPPSHGMVPGPGINYTGPRGFLMEFVILVY
jgi:hypothetical protein